MFVCCYSYIQKFLNDTLCYIYQENQFVLNKNIAFLFREKQMLRKEYIRYEKCIVFLFFLFDINKISSTQMLIERVSNYLIFYLIFNSFVLHMSAVYGNPLFFSSFFYGSSGANSCDTADCIMMVAMAAWTLSSFVFCFCLFVFTHTLFCRP